MGLFDFLKSKNVQAENDSPSNRFGKLPLTLRLLPNADAAHLFSAC